MTMVPGTMRQWFCRFITTPETRLVRVKSWRPSRGPYGWEWPTMLIDRKGMRSTATPVWDYWQWRAVWLRLTGREAGDVDL